MDSAEDDVILIVDCEEFPANKHTLSSCSEYFRGMFASNMKETRENKVEIHGVGKKQMSLLLKLANGGPFEVESLEELFSLTKAASMLVFESVLQQCQKQLLCRLKKSNCIAMMCIGYELALNDLYERARSYCVYFFEDVCNFPEFLDLDSDELLRLLDDKCLYVCEEMNVLNAIVRWVDAKPGRLSHLDALLCCVHWSEINVDMIKGMPEYAKILPSPLWRCIKEGKNLGEKSAIPEKCWRYRHQCLPLVPLLWGHFCAPSSEQACEGPKPICHDSNSVIKSELVLYQSKSLDQLVDVPEFADFPFGSAVATCGYDLYVSGGQPFRTGDQWNKYVWRYSGLQQKWTKLCQMPGSGHLRHHASVVWKKHLYILGGFGRFRIISSKAYRYSLQKSCWEDIPQLSSPLFGASACVHDGRVFVMKGSVEYWGEGDQCWTLLNCRDMPWTSGLLACGSLGSQIYVVTRREFVSLDPMTGLCKIIPLPPTMEWSDCCFLQTIGEFVLILKETLDVENEDESQVYELMKYHPATNTFIGEDIISHFHVKHFLVGCTDFLCKCSALNNE